MLQKSKKGIKEKFLGKDKAITSIKHTGKVLNTEGLRRESSQIQRAPQAAVWVEEDAMSSLVKAVPPMTSPMAEQGSAGKLPG